ncbi:MAG TPA: amidohydrolase family protein [Burkholderiaceae bacterium]|nr:amidohydrolase family protein [Burkholderiaceae bacterium]
MERDTTGGDRSGRLPEGACDCHVHIYGPYDRYPAQHEGRFAPREEAPVEALFRMWDAIGVARGVIVHATSAGPDNAVTLDALRRFPDRLRGVAILKADVADRTLDELTDAGFRGVRINLLRQDGRTVLQGGASLEDLEALAPRLAERGWHAQLWVESGDLQALAPRLETLPLDFVIDHQSRTMTDKGVDYEGFRWFCDRLRGGDRYWCKLSGIDRNSRRGSPYDDTHPFMRALVAAAPDRLVWGTDWPHVGHAADAVPSERVLIDALERCVPDAEVRRAILVTNAERLYGF